MLAVLAALLPVFLLIALGWGLYRLDFPGRAFWHPAERLVYYVLFPALLFRSVATAHLGDFDPLRLGAALLAGIFALSLLLLVLRPLLRIDGPAFSSVFQGALRFNSYVGFGAVAALYGAVGITRFAVILAMVVPVLNILSVVILVRFAAGRASSLRHQFKLLAQNPLILSCVAGIVVNFLGIPLPPGASPVLDSLGKASLPLGLMAVGAALDLAALGAARRPVLLSCGFKLLMLPFMVAIACRLFGVDAASTAVAVLWAGLPSASSAYILARQLGGDAVLMAGVITASTLLAALTTAPMLALLLQ